MRANPEKYDLLINNSTGWFQIKIGNETVTNSKYDKLLGIKIDPELNVNNHVSRRLTLCKEGLEENKCSLKNSIFHDI